MGIPIRRPKIYKLRGEDGGTQNGTLHSEDLPGKAIPQNDAALRA